MAPEYALWGYLTYKADVYSFGVVVLEIVSGKSNNYMPSENCVCLLDWVCHYAATTYLCFPYGIFGLWILRRRKGRFDIDISVCLYLKSTKFKYTLLFNIIYK